VEAQGFIPAKKGSPQGAYLSRCLTREFFPLFPFSFSAFFSASERLAPNVTLGT